MRSTLSANGYSYWQLIEAQLTELELEVLLDLP